MSSLSILLRHSFRRVRSLVLATGCVLVAFQVILLLVARSIESSGSFEQLAALIPPFVRELIGPSFTGFLSYRGIVCLGYFHAAVLAALLALTIALGTVPAAEIDIGLMDLVLSRPVARHWVVTRAIILGIICIAALLATMMLGTWIGLHGLAPKGVRWPDGRLIGSLALNLGLLMVAWNAIAMALGGTSPRRGTAGALAGLFAFATFLLDYVARIWQPAQSVAWLSPFRYFSPFELVAGQALPTRHLLVLAGIAAGGYALSYFLFSRRDISH